jgi:phosphoribosylformylglycinamidine synthase subunit PurL
VGTVTAGGALRVLDRPDGEVLADVPASTLHEDAPLYDREQAPPADLEARRADSADRLPPADDPSADVLRLLDDPSWAYRQYDHQLFLNTVQPPGGDAAVLRLKAPGIPSTSRGLALSVDGNGRWCAVDPRQGTAMLVAEAALNVACAGARPVAVVNCLNFGNPEHPEVMWQLSEAIDGMGEACRALRLPVIGGNVSLYNESRGNDIDPTPVVGVVGLIDDLRGRPPGVSLQDGGVLMLLGDPTARGLDGSAWAALRGHRAGSLPGLDLTFHTHLLTVVRELVAENVVTGIHDVSTGGLAVTLAEMVRASGVGATVAGLDDHGQLFSEAPSRVIVCVAPDSIPEMTARADRAGVPVQRIGEAGGDRLIIGSAISLALDELRPQLGLVPA